VEKEMKMAEAMRKLNRVIHRSTLSANFVSLFFAEIESTGNVFYVNAGHPPPILVHGSAVKRLESTGMILGAVSDVEFNRASASFEPGAVLVMYSDGVLERQNGNEEFGLTRLQELVIRHQQESVSAILKVIYQTIFAFGDQSRWQDDVTVVVIKKAA
jgi:phosphoserine phosphatase RsbU/P